MKKSLAIILMVILGTVPLLAAAFEKEVHFKTTKVYMSSERPLTVGPNTLVLKITQNGELAREAIVRVKAFMPAMPGMPAMQSLADAKALDDGTYEVTVDLAMGGTWQLYLSIVPTAGKKSRIKTSLSL